LFNTTCIEKQCTRPLKPKPNIQEIMGFTLKPEKYSCVWVVEYASQLY